MVFFMKNLQQITKSRAGVIGMIGLLALSLSSCLKNNNNDNYYDTTPVAGISVINVSPDSQPLDFYLDNNKANTTPIPYGDGLDYTRAYTGKRNATFYLTGTQTKIKTDTMTLRANRYYTLFLANLVSKPDYVLLRDTLTQPAAGKAGIRFVNLGSDAPAVDLAIKGGAVLVSNKAYKSFSTFVPVAGGTKYTLEIRQAGTAAVLATSTEVTLQSGSLYTVWLQGLTGKTDNTTFKAKIQLNAYY
jgi:hypothetical protein